MKTEQYDLPNEEWKWVQGFQNLYAVSNLGRCKRIFKSGSIHYTLGGITDSGHLHISLCRNGKVISTPRVHDLVFEAFYRKLQPNEIVHHLNEIKTQNQKTNLVAWTRGLHNVIHHTGMKHSQQTKIKISNSLKEAYLVGKR